MRKLAIAIALSSATLPAFAEFEPGFSAEILYGKADQTSKLKTLLLTLRM